MMQFAWVSYVLLCTEIVAVRHESETDMSNTSEISMGSEKYLGAIPFECGTTKLIGPFEHMVEGSVVGLHHMESPHAGVVAKMSTNKFTTEELENECNILKFLEKKNISGLTHCEAFCSNKAQGRDYIITSPWVDKGAFQISGEVPQKKFDSKSAWLQAVQETLRISWDMLQVGVVDVDRDHNIFYWKDGKVLFFDLGRGFQLEKQDPKDEYFGPEALAQLFLFQIFFEKIPQSLLEGVTPSQSCVEKLPRFVKTCSYKPAKQIQEFLQNLGIKKDWGSDSIGNFIYEVARNAALLAHA